MRATVICVLLLSGLAGCGGGPHGYIPNNFTPDDLHRLAIKDHNLSELEPLKRNRNADYVALGKNRYGSNVYVEVSAQGNQV